MMEKIVTSVANNTKKSHLPGARVIGSWELNMVRINVFRQLFKLVKTHEKGLLRTVKTIRNIKAKYEKVFGEAFLSKVVQVNDKYFWRLAAPQFPSRASAAMQKAEVDRFFRNGHRHGLRSLIFAITKKCPLQCAHCFEWPNLNKPEILMPDDLVRIVQKYQDYGTTQMMLSGGEPMTRLNDIYKILENARPWTDFWIITSGFGVNLQNALKLREKGLTGMMISIDHFESSIHNAFRGSDKAFNWAINAVHFANEARLIVSLSLCVTKEFVNSENLSRYMEFAKDLRVGFVQIIDPRAAGRWENLDISLNAEQYKLLDNFYNKYNTKSAYKSYPIINYIGYHQRKVGCFGSGDRFMYIDTDGDAHICPYCVSKIANARDLPVENTIRMLSEHQCDMFRMNEVG